MEAKTHTEQQPPRLLPPHYFALTLVLIAATLPLQLNVLTSPWPWLGLVPVLAGIWVALKGSRQFAARGTNIIPFTPATALVQDGVFAWSRNPMYSGMLLAVGGCALLANNPLAWLAVFVFYLIIRWRFVRHEETQMLATFDDAYIAYQKRVRRWL